MDLENCRPAVEEEQIDNLNDETFGDGAVEDDWEASHLAKLDGDGIPLPVEGLHHDDAILGAVTTTMTAPQNGSHTPKSSSAVGEVSGTSL
ncbi:hypothetical protein GBAR_LOCUS24585 [Geodia barretti]|uniref:Uncharacterized protein n=1 Tax=Geodia barretti TaxID=519541 RepID=A0AA35XAJ1_GEOBA|nr:hypothetical protein GBAR_LOCUS24585 [Geodia barretti]